MEVGGKKINVKYYLNQEVKGKRINFNDAPFFPLYVRVTYNRKTTRFSVANNWFPLHQEPNLETITELHSFKEVIGKVVAFEVNRYKEKFRLSGLGERIKTYSSRIFPGLEALLDKDLKGVMREKLSDLAFQAWDQKSLYDKVAQSLDLFGGSLPNLLRERMVATAYFAPGSGGDKMLIYSWLVSDERDKMLQQFNEKVESLLSKKDRVNFVAFDKIELKNSDDYTAIIDSVDRACLELLDLGYTEHVEIKVVSLE
ncbi:MAG: hypothetical protein AAFO03_15850 [Bacteroidota bacterium]